MFEVILISYLITHLVYIALAKRQLKHTVEGEDFLYTIGAPIVRRLPLMFRDKVLSKEELLRLSQLHSPKNLERATRVYLGNKVGLVYLVLALGGFFALVLGHDYLPAGGISSVIERPSFGEADTSIELTYEVEGEEGQVDGSIPITIEARLPVGDEALKVLESNYESMILMMLAQGDQQNHVTHDLVFAKQPFEQPVEVTYRSLTPDVMTHQGQLRINNMSMDQAYDFSVLVTMTFSDRQVSNTYGFVAYRLPMTLEEELNRIEDRIVVEENQVLLPETLMERNNRLSWNTGVSGVRGVQVFALAVALAMVVFLHRKEALNKALSLRQERILQDFPDVVSKLTMLMNAGMTFSRAWQKIVADYQARSKIARPLYEEMFITTTQIQNGMPEREALEAFGRRTGCKEVIHMSLVLSQNLRRGSHSLTDTLKQLSSEAWDIRTNNAKMLGEKASTKLLLPMGISFITVVIIVLAPTLMSMHV